ncbi:MAG: SH3 domain-containing protein [Chloroflexi bacterium]|nr:SH3 domain-containing protein [Chloroflexota bacterium]
MRRRQFVRASAAVGVSALIAPAAGVRAQTALSAGMQASVTSDGVNLRGGPGADQPVVGTLAVGSTVDLLGGSASGAWWRAATDAGVGYVNAALLQATGEPVTSSVFDVDLAVPYAQQLTDIWCDPADLEMWLSYRQSRSTDGGTRALQSAIWDWETSHNAGFSVDQWDCSPYAVASAASHWMSDTGFDHFTYDDALSGSRLLAWLVANRNYREPSIALIWRGLHYVLVRGVRAVGDPGQDPTGAQLLGFYVADPDPGASFWLGQDRFIPIDRWLNEMFSPVSYLTPHTGVAGDTWQNRMVSIQRSWSAAGPTQAGQRNASAASYG